MLKRFFSRLIDNEVTRQVDLAVRALDDSRDRLYSKSTYPRDRHGYDRDEINADALEAWRVNPLARRIIGMMTQYVVGGGIGVESNHERTNKFIQDWWNHRLNRMAIRVYEWCDELSRSGDLFVVVSTDQSGMSYMRAIPSADIMDIETAENDLDQETIIIEKPSPDYTSQTRNDQGLMEGRRWAVYDQENDHPNEDGKFNPVMVHYAINRPVGAKFGESDLSPILRWLTRYASWLEDRARLNRYRNTFLFWVKARFSSQAEKLERQAELNRNPPNPGSILVSDESEEWKAISPNLSSFEAAEDGLALKKMIAVGAGYPMHFLAEPESATRTTAESAGGPTFRHLQQRQEFFLWLLEDLTRIVLKRRKYYDRLLHVDDEIKLSGTDISARDNAALAAAASTIIGSFIALRNRGLIDDQELLRMAYRFAGEVVDIEELIKRGEEAPPPKVFTPETPSGSEDG
ncbi:MAG: hypothetical protein ACWGOY_13100, partial [Anaerolineales bacterium]